MYAGKKERKVRFSPLHVSWEPMAARHVSATLEFPPAIFRPLANERPPRQRRAGISPGHFLFRLPMSARHVSAALEFPRAIFVPAANGRPPRQRHAGIAPGLLFAPAANGCPPRQHHSGIAAELFLLLVLGASQ
jgi:hypothetical protein